MTHATLVQSTHEWMPSAQSSMPGFYQKCMFLLLSALDLCNTSVLNFAMPSDTLVLVVAAKRMFERGRQAGKVM